MGQELLNASFGELLPPISVNDVSSSASFTSVGASMKDVIITNTGPNGCIITSSSEAIIPTDIPSQESAYVAAGAIVTLRKGLGVTELNFICPIGTAIIWAQSTNGA